ncbi:hypothetical protein D3C75_1284410 [compost metagenome]
MQPGVIPEADILRDLKIGGERLRNPSEKGTDNRPENGHGQRRCTAGQQLGSPENQHSA